MVKSKGPSPQIGLDQGPGEAAKWGSDFFNGKEGIASTLFGGTLQKSSIKERMTMSSTQVKHEA